MYVSRYTVSPTKMALGQSVSFTWSEGFYGFLTTQHVKKSCSLFSTVSTAQWCESALLTTACSIIPWPEQDGSSRSEVRFRDGRMHGGSRGAVLNSRPIQNCISISHGDGRGHI